MNAILQVDCTCDIFAFIGWADIYFDESFSIYHHKLISGPHIIINYRLCPTAALGVGTTSISSTASARSLVLSPQFKSGIPAIISLML